jgi:hypothetical protein
MKIIDHIISKSIYLSIVCILVFGLTTGLAIAHIDGIGGCELCTCQKTCTYCMKSGDYERFK